MYASFLNKLKQEKNGKRLKFQSLEAVREV